MTSTKIKAQKRVFSHDDYDDAYRIINKKILRYVGLRITRKDSPFARLCWNIFYWVNFMGIFIPFWMDCVTAYNIYRGLLKQDNILFMILPCMGYLVLAMMKSYKMVTNRDIYQNLISELRDMWPVGVVSEEEETIVSKALKELSIVLKGYYWCNVFLLVSVVGQPCVDIIRRAFDTDVPRTLPFFYWLPYDEYQPVAYECTLVMHTWQTMLTLWFIQAGDLLFCTYLSHITTQFDLLCVRIEKLFPVAVDQQLIAEYPLGQQIKESGENESVRTERNSKQETELKKCLLRHNDLIRLSNDVENLFSFSLLVNFIYSSFIICLCGFCSVVIEKWNEFMYKTFLATSLAQTWLLCSHGQKLLDSSTRVANALYSSGWYTVSFPLRKSIAIMIIRSQKPVCVTTYGFSVISLSSYATIIKSSWSYFTLLLNTYSNP